MAGEKKKQCNVVYIWNKHLRRYITHMWVGLKIGVLFITVFLEKTF